MHQEVRMLRHWNGHKVGRTIAPQIGVAEVLVRRGIAEVVGLETKSEFPFEEPNYEELGFIKSE